MEILTPIFYFIITIGVLVFIHELGHFAAAKFFRMRVDRFSIGFPPRAFGKKFGETDYCVSWIPIGGYVKIAGMIDESFDTEHLDQEPQPWEFRAKPIWQRMIVISAGVIMNILLALVILWAVAFSEGKILQPITAVGYVLPESPAEKAGIQRGDIIREINGIPMEYWTDVENTIYAELIGQDITLRVERGGTEVDLSLDRASIPSISEERFGIFPSGVLPTVGVVDAGKPAEEIGMQPGDVIQSINGEPVDFYTLSATVKKNAEKEMQIEWERDGQHMSSLVTPTSEGRIGITLRPEYTGPTERIQFSFFGALGEGAANLWGITTLIFKNIYAIIAGSVSFSESVGGPVRIAQMATQSAQVGFLTFLTVIAWLSLSLAILNILPFPALDGGHLMFLFYEGIFGKEIPGKVKIAIQQAGFFLLLVFMAFVVYNDIISF